MSHSRRHNDFRYSGRFDPGPHLSEHPHFGTWGAMLGFVVMMALDVALG